MKRDTFIDDWHQQEGVALRAGVAFRSSFTTCTAQSSAQAA